MRFFNSKNKFSKIILGLCILILLSSVVVISSSDNWDKIGAFFIIKSLSNKNESQISINEKFLLFKSFIKLKQLPEALTVAASLEKNTSELTQNQSIYISRNVGKILRFAEGYGAERLTYKHFLKKKSPATYHFLMASSYEAEGDTLNRDLELSKAKKTNEKTNK